ncbi:MAG: transglutaminase-like domain-containing protein [Parcubacteria group bacterium]
MKNAEQSEFDKIELEKSKYLQFGKYTEDCPGWLLEKAKSVVSEKIDESYVKKILSLINDEFNTEKHQITKTTDFRKSRFIGVKCILDKRLQSCGAVASVIASVFRGLGIPTKLVHGYLGEEKENRRHAWNEIYFDGAWHPFDITRGNFAVGEKHVRKGEYVDWADMEKDYDKK